MAFDMNRNLLEREWVLPKLREIESRIKDIDAERDTLKYVHTLFGKFSLRLRGSNRLSFLYHDMHPVGLVAFCIVELYEQYFRELQNWVAGQKVKDKEFVQNVVNELTRSGDSRLLNVKKGRVIELQIRQEDADWLARTRTSKYFKRHKEVITKLLKDVESNVNEQKSVLDLLFRQ
jgi:hypothetical protein